MLPKTLNTITKVLLLSVIVVTPFVKVSSLYFPFISGRVYLFRALVMLAFFFWVWLMFSETKTSGPSTYEKNHGVFNTYRVFKNILVVALVLFFLAQVLVSFFGVDPVFSFFSSISRADGTFQYGFWVLYFLMLISVFREARDWKTLFSIFIIVAFFISLFAWLGFPPDQEIYGNFFGNPAYFSGFLIFSIGFSLLAVAEGSAFISPSRFTRVFERKFFNSRFANNLFVIAALFFAVTLIFTQIRGAFIGLAGGIFLFCLLSILFLRKENKKLAYSAGIVLLVGVISLIVLFGFKDTDFVKNTSVLSRVTSITDIREPGSARERVLVWNIAFKAFQEKPIFGWGPENFASALNKYYDHWAGEKETWFDRAHNTPLDILGGGGIFLFSFYLFWLLAAFFLISKIGRHQKILSFILASVLLAYFLQGLFFFDTFATLLGLSPFLAYLVYQAEKSQITNRASRQRCTGRDENEVLSEHHKSQTNSKFQIPNYKLQSIILIAAALFSLFVIYATVIMPWKANASALKFYTHTEAGFYKTAKPFLEDSFSVKSPYTYWQVRKETGWQFLSILEDRVKETMAPEDIRAIEEIYDFITPELEKFIENRPYEPQMYYVLARIYRAGFEKLGRDDLPKAETILKKAQNFSNLRKEYFAELKQVLLLQGKLEEAEKLLQDYVKRVDFYPYFPYLTMGHFYFETEKYEQALEQYEKAKTTNYDFCRVPEEYSRYMFSAEETKQYQRIVVLAEKCLEKWGPDADTYFNIAVGYFYLGDKETAKEFFLKALELNQGYEEYREFFLD